MRDMRSHGRAIALCSTLFVLIVSIALLVMSQIEVPRRDTTRARARLAAAESGERPLQSAQAAAMMSALLGAMDAQSGILETWQRLSRLLGFVLLAASAVLLWTIVGSRKVRQDLDPPANDTLKLTSARVEASG